MLGIPKQRMLRSVTKYGLVDVTVDFEDGTDIYWARQQVSERLANISADLPTGITGGMAPSPRRWARCSCSRSSRDHDAGGAAQPARLGDPPGAAVVPGVADVNALGGKVRSFEWCPTRCGWRPWAVDRQVRPPSTPTTATTARAAWVKAMRCCWCAAKAASAPWTT
jgi:Cu/Ag efflux pump CusA